MKKVLKLKIKDENGKTTVISIANPKLDLSLDVVKASMQKIVDADSFEKNGVKVYAKVVGANYYSTQSDDIFEEAE